MFIGGADDASLVAASRLPGNQSADLITTDVTLKQLIDTCVMFTL